MEELLLGLTGLALALTVAAVLSLGLVLLAAAEQPAEERTDDWDQRRQELLLLALARPAVLLFTLAVAAVLLFALAVAAVLLLTLAVPPYSSSPWP